MGQLIFNPTKISLYSIRKINVTNSRRQLIQVKTNSKSSTLNWTKLCKVSKVSQVFNYGSSKGIFSCLINGDWSLGLHQYALLTMKLQAICKLH